LKYVRLLLTFPALIFFACGAGTTSIDFSGGAYGFLTVDESPPGAAGTALSLVDYRDGKAVLVSGGIPYLAIDASSLLGKRVSQLRIMELTLGLERSDGEFYAASGEIRAYSGGERTESSDPWSVYLPEKNPNTARAVLEEGERFIPGSYNFFILTKKVDNALEAGLGGSNLIVSKIRFLDGDGKELKVDPNAVFNAPSGFGERDLSNLLAFDEEQTLERTSGSSKNWGQALALDTVKNGGSLDPAAFTGDAAVLVYYSSAGAPELILQSWTEGAPPSSGWAKLAPSAINDTASCAQFLCKDMAGIFGTGDFSAYLDKFYVGDTGAELKVYALSVVRLR
jgi:hypothetical protein